MSTLRKTIAVALAATLALVALTWALPAGAASVEPVFVDGNPSCTELGYKFGFKVDPPTAGTYNIDGVNTVTVTTDGVYFDWSSTLGMDAVIAKGGPNANVYVYDPPAEAANDIGLHSPINPNNGNPFGLSHIEFCYDYEVTVSKTAATTFTRTFGWTINKTVTPDTWNLFTGDSGTSKYTVSVTKDAGTDSNWAVNGTIKIENKTPLDATITAVSDAVSGFGAVAPNCGVAFPYTLAAGGTLNCNYSSALPDGSSRTNTATVMTSGVVGGGSATANVVFGDPTTVVNSSINVDDTNGGSWNFTDSGSASYTKTFTCDADEGTHNNTATIRQTGQSASASVTVNCYALGVTKDASTSLTRTWKWTIDKLADQSTLTLAVGQSFLVNYTVVVDASSADSNFAVSGNIAVNNPAPIAATLNSVSDIVSGVGAASVNCGVSYPYTLAAGATLSCSYSASLPDTASRTNTATATLQNYDFNYDGTSMAAGTTDFNGTAAVDFANAKVNEVDESINVSDSIAGLLGTATVGVDSLPKTFSYSRYIGPYETCATYTVVNTASFATNDTGAAGSDGWTVNVNVPCQDGCTLTPGYWKTHSEFGPAPYDDTWALLPNGASTPFFLSGQTYYQVLWTAPQGNAYYILAHAYIAAKLNVYNGASTTPQVDTALSFAESFFNTYAPTATLTKAQRAEVISYATILDNYNNGLIGPGHCSE